MEKQETQIVVEKQETHIVMEHQKRPFGLPPPMRKPCFVIEIEHPHATLLLLSYKSSKRPSFFYWKGSPVNLFT